MFAAIAGSGRVQEPMHVSPELLAASGAQADTESRALRSAAGAADAAIDSALPGWVGQSHTTLAASAARWAAATTALSARVHQHAEMLRLSALTFAEMDAGHARALAALHRSAGAR